MLPTDAIIPGSMLRRAERKVWFSMPPSKKSNSTSAMRTSWGSLRAQSLSCGDRGLKEDAPSKVGPSLYLRSSAN